MNTKEKEIKKAVDLIIMCDLMPIQERQIAIQKIDAIKKKYGLKNLKKILLSCRYEHEKGKEL